METMVSVDSTIVATKEQVSADLAGESVILNLKSGVYYGLDPVGATVWGLIQEPKSLSEVRDAILAEYDVTAAQCENDLIALLGQLESEGLIEVQSAASA